MEIPRFSANAPTCMSARRDGPVVLGPGPRQVCSLPHAKLAHRLLIPHRDGRQRCHVPRGRVIPDGKQRFDIGRNGATPRVKITAAEIAPEQIAKNVVQVLPPELHVMATGRGK